MAIKGAGGKMVKQGNSPGSPGHIGSERIAASIPQRTARRMGRQHATYQLRDETAGTLTAFPKNVGIA